MLGLLNEVSDAPMTLEQLGEDHSGLWMTRTSGDERGAMLIAVEYRDREVVGIDVVDRINGLRDRSQVSKAVVVTRSSFTADVTAEYAAHSQRMDLVDFDRLTGLLADEGWTSSAPGFLMTPVRERPRHRIFISNSWEQRDIAVELYNRLHGWQYSCFLDSTDLLPGDTILAAVERALAGTDAVLLLCSKQALSSPWVRAEIGFCLEREKESRRVMLIPLRVDGTRFKRPYADLNGRLAADLTPELGQISAYVGRPRFPVAGSARGSAQRQIQQNRRSPRWPAWRARSASSSNKIARLPGSPRSRNSSVSDHGAATAMI